MCGQEKTLEAEVTYASGVYTASVELDGEPTEPADAENVCPWCGEKHDIRTFTGFWTEFFHDLFYIFRQIFFWFV